MTEFEIELPSDLTEGQIVTAGPAGEEVIVTKVADRVVAVGRWCTHERVDLADGLVIENEIFCPLHFSSFDLSTGAVMSPPAEVPLRCYSVTGNGSKLRLALNESPEPKE